MWEGGCVEGCYAIASSFLIKDQEVINRIAGEGGLEYTGTSGWNAVQGLVS
jgi:hypothetical protein